MTKEVVQHTLVYRSSEGDGDMTMSFEGYSEEFIEKIKIDFKRDGWVFVGHDRDIIERDDEDTRGLTKLKLFLSGLLLGGIGHLLFQMWVNAGG